MEEEYANLMRIKKKGEEAIRQLAEQQTQEKNIVDLTEKRIPLKTLPNFSKETKTLEEIIRENKAKTLSEEKMSGAFKFEKKETDYSEKPATDNPQPTTSQQAKKDPYRIEPV